MKAMKSGLIIGFCNNRMSWSNRSATKDCTVGVNLVEVSGAGIDSNRATKSVLTRDMIQREVAPA